MTSDRPYHSALPFQAARDEIERKAGILFDPEVARVFLRLELFNKRLLVRPVPVRYCRRWPVNHRDWEHGTTRRSALPEYSDHR
jgi:hypothetical protein